MPISVLLVGCCETDFLGFCRLARELDFQVEFDSTDSKSALQRLSRSRVDVVVINAHLPEEKGPLPLLASVKQHREYQAVLLFAIQEHPSILTQAANLGALGVILITDPLTQIADRIRGAAEGRSGWSREDLRRLASTGGTSTMDIGYPVPLNRRERDILTHVTQGGTNKQIAQTLGISYETVKEHIQNLLQKIGVTDRSQAAIWAVHHEVV
jgi:DNA-binding NarL/FixJ family response regulator